MRVPGLATGLLVVFAGCATLPAPQNPNVGWAAQFNEAEYAPYKQAGTAQITGQAFMKTVGGDVKLCAGNPVTLDPATSYGQEWWKRAGSVYRYKNWTPPDPRFLEYRKTTTCDAAGHFRFDGLPAGSYFVRTEVSWYAGSEIQGGLVGQAYDVKEGQTLELVITQ